MDFSDEKKPPPASSGATADAAGGGGGAEQQKLRRSRRVAAAAASSAVRRKPVPGTAGAAAEKPTKPVSPKPPPSDAVAGTAARDPPEDDDDDDTDALVAQAPRTLRLLRLVSSGSSSHASSASALLGDVAARSSPLLLWDLLGHLQGCLSSKRWGARSNAAAAMERVARCLPGEDARRFLGEGWEGVRDGGGDDEGGGGRNHGGGNDGNLWLSVDDLMDADAEAESSAVGGDRVKTPRGAGGGKLALILRDGRLLLASSGEQYDLDDAGEGEASRERRLLSDLDSSAHEGAGAFLERRIELQRTILARRLGLGGILSAPVVTSAGAGDVGGMIGEEDIRPDGASSAGTNPRDCDDDEGTTKPKKDKGGDKKRKRGGRGKGKGKGKKRPKKKKKKFADDESSSDEDEQARSGTVRALLVLEMRRTSTAATSRAASSAYGPSPSSSAAAAASHQNPQTLLATDLLYRTFDPNWHVRHGALLGIRSLLVAWRTLDLKAKVSAKRRGDSKKDEGDEEVEACFGRWPHDILARCLCLLALDRFGDFAGAAISAGPDGGGGGVGASDMVAPVREVAAQLLALLLSAAPVPVRSKSLAVLGQLARYESEDGWTGWEVRHGAVLGLKYAGALLPLSVGRSVPKKEDESDERDGGSEDMVALAVSGLSDQNDDVRGAAASALSSLLRASDGGKGGTSDVVTRIAASASSPLWSALLSANVVSSCCSDLLALLGDLVAIDCGQVVRGIDGAALPPSSIEAQCSFQLVGPGVDVSAEPPPPAAASDVEGRRVRIAALESMLSKLLEFLSFDAPSVRMSTLGVISHVAKPVALAAVSSVTDSAGAGDDNATTNSPLERMTAAYCHLLERLFASHFDEACAGRSGGVPGVSKDDDQAAREMEERERRRAKRYTRSRDEAWTKIVQSLSILWTAEGGESSRGEAAANGRPESAGCGGTFPNLALPCGRKVAKTAVSLVLRLVGIEAHHGVSAGPPQRINLSPVGLEGKLCVNFAAQREAAGSLAGLCVRIGLAPRSTAASGTTASSMASSALGDVIAALLQSPWPEICEGGCILYGALALGAEQECIDDKNEDGDSKAAGRQPAIHLRACHERLVAMLDNSTPCLMAGAAAKVGSALQSSQVATICDAALSKFAEDRVLSRSCEGPTDDIYTLWRGVFQSAGVDWSGSASTVMSPTVTSMRLAASAAAAIVASGALPTKATALIQALMTSLKNETSDERADYTSRSIASLIHILSPTQGHDGPWLRARDRLLETAADLACIEVHDHSLSVDAPEATAHIAARHLLSTVVSSTRSSMAERTKPLWDRLRPLATSNMIPSPSHDLALGSPLRLLAAIAPGLSDASQPFIEVVDHILPNITKLACSGDIDPQLQSDALSSTATICCTMPTATMPTALPILLGCLRDLDNDNCRLNACRLLHSMVSTLETQICPFVHCLLPVAMSMMTDPIENCSRIAAAAFAILVRAAPLVSESNDARFQIPGLSNSDKCTDVINHLIHGKPLPPCQLPDKVRSDLNCSGVQLRKYQMEGVSWIHFLQSVKLNGALCDDMGLGKTLQALIGVAISHCRGEEGNGPSSKSLVVCPSSVVGHWVNEINKYFPSDKCFRVLQYSGSAKRRKALWADESDACNIVITNYSILRNDVKILSKKAWNYCVLDEGHLLKNPKTATARAARQLKCRHRLILTGTPVQNKVNELWAAFDFLMPNFLGSQPEFAREYARPITNGQLPDASADKISLGMNKLRSLHQQVLPFILRREKGQVMQELPPKVITDIPCYLSSEQQSLYKVFCARPEAKKAVKELEENTRSRDKSASKDGESFGKEVFKSLFYLRLLCTHPVLVAGKRQLGNRPSFSNSYASLDCSGKLRVLNDLLRSSGIYHEEMTGADNDDSLLYIDSEATASDSDLILQAESENVCTDEEDVTNPPASKCLIFAQFSQSLDVVEQFLFQPHMPSLRYLRLDGKVLPDNRTQIVERFNSDESIKALLLTTRVGGLGLNLTGADTVIFLEHDWNPHVDIQAMDRAHRIGQTKTVNVYRLVTSNTIEEKIMKMQQTKLVMSNAIVNTDNSTMFSMGTDKLLDLFAFDDNGGNESKRDTKNISQIMDSVDDTLFEEEYSSLSVKNFLHDLKNT